MSYQRGPDGRSIPPSDYPPIPEATHFWTGWVYEVPAEIYNWQWRTDYQAWGAVVRFKNGWCGITNPRPT